VNNGDYRAGANKSHTTPEGLYDLSKDFIFVTYNYREGIVGIANGPTFAHEGGSTNAAVRDTEQAYKWTKKYIHAFGGDPDNIIATSFSAGSSQTLDQITRYAGKAEQLFARAYINVIVLEAEQ
jgi:carboxylesterase type B